MAKFDWLRFCQRQRIEYVDSGENVAKGNINIQCPFCGPADKSHHMGLNLEKGWWGCWRNQSHRGKSPLRLLLQFVSRAEAEALLGKQTHTDAEGWASLVPGELFDRGEGKAATIKSVGELPEGCREIQKGGKGRLSAKFYSYLRTVRKFGKYTDAAIKRYKLQLCFKGPYNNRVVVPYFVNGELVTFTARSIYSGGKIRYKAPPKEEYISPTDVLFNADNCKGGEALFIVEGAFDAMRLDIIGSTDYSGKVAAVALSTLAISDEQEYSLCDVLQGYNKGILMLDPGLHETAEALKIKSRLSGKQYSNLQVQRLKGSKDVGAMTNPQVRKIAGGSIDESQSRNDRTKQSGILRYGS